MARNEVTVNVRLDDKQLKSLADEIRETFAKRIDELESRIAKVRDFAEDMKTWCSPHGVSVGYANRLLAVLDGEGEKENTDG